MSHAAPHPPCDAAAPGLVAPPSVREWTLLSTDPKDPRFRLRLSTDHDPHGLIRLSEEELTSRGPGAQVTETQCCLLLTGEQAEWLLGALGEMLGGAVALDLDAILRRAAKAREMIAPTTGPEKKYDAETLVSVLADDVEELGREVRRLRAILSRQEGGPIAMTASGPVFSPRVPEAT